MTITPAQIQALVETELATLEDIRVISHIRRLLVEPIAISRAWDYGVAGKTFPCWAVLNHAISNSGIVYCEFGFGPRTPWGLAALTGASRMSIGMDSGWFDFFMSAFFESAASTELPIWRVYKQEGAARPGIPLTGESDWESTWEEIYRLRAAEPNARYHCSHSIKLRAAKT